MIVELGQPAGQAVRRWRPVTASAAISTTPTNMSPGPLRRAGEREAGDAGAEQQDGDDRAAGVEAPVLELRRAEEGGGERRQQVRGAGASASPLPSIDASTMPVAPASPPDATSDRKRSRSTCTPASRAASGLKPVAYRRRPVAVCSSRYQMATATTAQ